MTTIKIDNSPDEYREERTLQHGACTMVITVAMSGSDHAALIAHTRGLLDFIQREWPGALDEIHTANPNPERSSSSRP